MCQWRRARFAVDRSQAEIEEAIEKTCEKDKAFYDGRGANMGIRHENERRALVTDYEERIEKWSTTVDEWQTEYDRINTDLQWWIQWAETNHPEVSHEGLGVELGGTREGTGRHR